MKKLLPTTLSVVIAVIRQKTLEEIMERLNAKSKKKKNIEAMFIRLIKTIKTSRVVNHRVWIYKSIEIIASQFWWRMIIKMRMIMKMKTGIAMIPRAR